MKNYLVIIIAFFLCLAQSPCLAQGNDSHIKIIVTPVSSNCGGKEIAFTKYSKTFPDSTKEEGLYLGGAYIESSFEFEEDSYVFAFGNQHGRRPILSFKCAGIQPGKLFNTKSKGVKNGLWFKFSINKKVRTATMYEDGKIIRRIYFRKSGKINFVANYKDGIKKKWGNVFYDEQGYIMNSTISL
jgi:hypothetical protein